jgi:hypothetical protein
MSDFRPIWIWIAQNKQLVREVCDKKHALLYAYNTDQACRGKNQELEIRRFEHELMGCNGNAVKWLFESCYTKMTLDSLGVALKECLPEWYERLPADEVFEPMRSGYPSRQPPVPLAVQSAPSMPLPWHPAPSVERRQPVPAPLNHNHNHKQEIQRDPERAFGELLEWAKGSDFANSVCSNFGSIKFQHDRAALIKRGDCQCEIEERAFENLTREKGKQAAVAWLFNRCCEMGTLDCLGAALKHCIQYHAHRAADTSFGWLLFGAPVVEPTPVLYEEALPGPNDEFWKPVVPEPKPQPAYPDRSEWVHDVVALEGEATCIICSENRKQCITLPCRHLDYCIQCSTKWVEKGNTTCPFCRQPITEMARVFSS